MRPTKEIADYMGKVTLVPNRSYLFSAGKVSLMFVLFKFNKGFGSHEILFGILI